MEVIVVLLALWLLWRLSLLWFRWWLKRRLTPREGHRPQRPEGEVRVEQAARAEKKVNRNVGDYVEFEEEITENCEEK